MISGLSWVKKEKEIGPGMLYMVGRIFLYGLSFNRVYNELGHKNITNFEYLFFTEFRTKKSIFLKHRWEGMNQHWVVIHTLIYQIGLLVRTQHN